MKFEYAITVRSQPDLAADYGRALERVAFFPGVTEANLIGVEIGSVTIGYNGKKCDTTLREFRSDLEADGLVADGHLWDTGQSFVGPTASNSITLLRRQTWPGNSHGTAILREFERRS